MTLISLDTIKKRKYIVNCSCEGDEFLKFLTFERDITEEDECAQIYVDISGTHIFGWRNKLKAIWSIIKNGEFENFGILMEKEEIKGLIKYLQEVLDYWEEERKKIKLDN